MGAVPQGPNWHDATEFVLGVWEIEVFREFWARLYIFSCKNRLDYKCAGSVGPLACLFVSTSGKSFPLQRFAFAFLGAPKLWKLFHKWVIYNRTSLICIGLLHDWSNLRWITIFCNTGPWKYLRPFECLSHWSCSKFGIKFIITERRNCRGHFFPLVLYQK